MMDYPRDQIMDMATRAIERHGGPDLCRVYFKFTCSHCGTRCTLNDPNYLWEEGECCECGNISRIEQAGFALHIGRVPVQGVK